MKALVLMAMAAAHLAAEPNAVTVYWWDNAGVPFGLRGAATGIASRIYRDIGVEIDWQLRKPDRNGVGDAIVIEFRVFTPPTLMPGALAFAQPFEGTHIVVFYDRIRETVAKEHLLAHVMAHEIGHILQGVMHHSESGIMKANWTLSDHGKMRYQPLTFTPYDIELIFKGMAQRAAKLQAAAPPLVE